MARYQHKSLEKGNDLLNYFRLHPGKIHESRRKFMVLMVMSLLTSASVSSQKLAISFASEALIDSNKKRIERFYRHFALDCQMFAVLIVAMLGLTGKLKLVLDRTDWKFGNTPINILTLVIIQEGATAIPLLFRFLPHKGSSSQAIRIELMEEFIRFFGPNRIEWLTADREFIGKEWLLFLQKHNIPFSIRVKGNQYLTRKNGKKLEQSFRLFQHLPFNIFHQHPSIVYLDGVPIHISGHRMSQNGYFIIASSEHSDPPADVYRQRWQIETMFKALKTNGFNLEDTHLKDPDRLLKLMVMLAIAMAWACKVGIKLYQQKAILRANRKLKYSHFSLGMSQIKRAIISQPQKLSALVELFTKPDVNFVRL